MPTPSNRTGIPALPVILLIAVILFLGLAVAPRTFEFRAWPEAGRNDAIEEPVDRPAEQAVEVPIARVETRRGDALGVRGRNPRGRAPARAGRSSTRERAESRTSRPRRPRGQAPSAPQVVVEESPVPASETPEPAPQQEAQLAEAPSSDEVLRPNPEPVPAEVVPEPLAPEATPPEDPRQGVSGRRAAGHRSPGRSL